MDLGLGFGLVFGTCICDLGLGLGIDNINIPDLEYLHVSGDEVSQVLPDEVELVHVAFAWPQRLALHKLHKHTAWKIFSSKKISIF